MSLGIALDAAVSALATAQEQIRVTSNNIANANTPGYSRQVASQSPQIVAGIGAGVVVQDVQRVIDQFFTDTARLQSSDVARSGVIDDFYQRIQIFLGTPTDANSVTSQINNFFTSMSSLATSPDQTFFQTDAVSKANLLATGIATLAKNLETTRFNIDQEINNTISDLNAQLDRLRTANAGIQQASSLGQPTASILDERDNALAVIAQYLDININYSVNGQAFVGTPGGPELLGTTQYIVQYTPLGGVNNFVNDDPFGDIKVEILERDGEINTNATQFLVTGGTSDEVATTMRSGKLVGLLQLRDKLLPPILEQLDVLAAAMRDEVNAIHNSGSGFPPANALTGTTNVLNSDAHIMSGSVRIGVVNSDGSPPTSPFADEEGVRPLMLKLSELDSGTGFGEPDMQTIIDEINRYYGPQTRKVEIGNLNNIKLAAREDSIVNGTNFTFDLDLDNLSGANSNIQVLGVAISGGGALVSGLPFNTTIAAGDRGRTAPGGNEITVSLAGGGPTWDIDLTVQVTNTTTGAVFNDVITWQITAAASGVMNERYTATAISGVGDAGFVNPTSIQSIASASLVDANGVAVPPGTGGFLKIQATRSTDGVSIDELNSIEQGFIFGANVIDVTNRGFSHFFGLNNLFVDTYETVNSAYDLTIRSDIRAKPGLISTGQLVLSKQPSNPADEPLYTYELGKGNNAVAQRLANLQNSRISFLATSETPGTVITLSDFSSQLLSFVSSKSNNATAAAANDKLIGDKLQERNDSAKGVNLDEEAAKTIQYEKNYQAAARLISVISELFESLINAV